MLEEHGQRLTKLWASYHGQRENPPFIPSRDKILEMERSITSLNRDLSPIESIGSQEERLKKQMIHLADVLSFRLQDDRAYPHRYLTNCNRAIAALFLFYPLSLEEKMHRMRAINSSLEPLFKEIRSLASTHDLPTLKNQLKAQKRLLLSTKDDLKQKKADAWYGRIEDELNRGLQITERAILDLQSNQGEKRAEPLPYRELLKRVFGIQLDDLLSWHRDEVKNCQRAVQEIGERIDAKRHPFEILKEDLPPCDSIEGMFQEMEGFVEMARDRTKMFLSLPQEEECLVAPVPLHLKESYPWGGCSGPDALSGIKKSLAFLNQYNYKCITRGWLMMMAIHECYPGHHTQRVMIGSSSLPSPYKLSHLLAPSGPIIEGQAHYAERMLQDLFPDQAFPLFVAYRRLHTAVRIWADLLLHHYGKEREEAVELYRDYVGFSKDEATGQVLFQELWPGYMTIYYYGMKFLESLKEKMRVEDEELMKKIYEMGFVGIGLFEEGLLHGKEN